MAIITATEFQNNIWQVINTIPREPVIMTKHGKNYGIFLRYDEPIEFGYTEKESLSDETRTAYEEARKLDKSAFINF